MSGLATRGIPELLRLLDERELSAVELTRSCLDDIEHHDDSVGAFTTVTAETALQVAREADDRRRRGERGPLLGIPVALKDNIDSAGTPTTAGSSFYGGALAERDAAVTARLRMAGAVVLGKTNMHEFAWGATTENETFGTTRNPWDLSRTAHGSSGGSAAAVAAGFCVAALGTDTGGSIRNPAAVTGITGLRPTVGGIDLDGVLPLAWSMDTVGPLARSVADVSIVHAVLDRVSAPRGAGAGGRSLGQFRVGVIRDAALECCDPPVRAAFERAIDEIRAGGASVIHLELPDIEAYYDAWLITQSAEAAVVHTRMMKEHAEDYSEEVLIQLEAGAQVSTTDYLEAQRYRQHLRERFEILFAELDVILTPTFASVAPLVGGDPFELLKTRFRAGERRRSFTALPSVLAFPALSVPCGFVDGLPVGMQVIAGAWQEADCLEFGIGYQAATEWHRAVAPLV
jgi:aspartyl-tRNA(Asn)/glutamyl-tRNA(Gln) amidotransferase subunit A